MIFIVKLLLYMTMPLLAALMVRELLYFRRRSPPNPLIKLQYALTDQQQTLQRLYRDEQLDAAFVSAGLPFTVSGWQYRFYRDGFFILWVAFLHAHTFLSSGVYPIRGLIICAVCYVLSWGGRRFTPLRMLLDMMRKEKQSKKNDEIFDLYLLLSNDYHSETVEHYQSIFKKLTEYRRYLKALRKDLDQLLFNYPIEGSKAFKRFGERVGTKEAKSLASLMEKIDHSNPETAVDLLDENYETFLDFRRQRRKKKLKMNGYIGFTIVFISTLTLIYFVNVVTNVYKSNLLDVLNH